MSAGLLEHALKFAARGWPVFPLRDRSKNPYTEHGLLEATTDAEQIERWWRKWPNANIGIATGRAAGFFVLDEDPGKGGRDSLGDLLAIHGQLPDTPQVLTSNDGRHTYWRYPDNQVVRNSAGKVGPGLDVRGDGGYVVAAGSIHPTGHVYDWELSSHPDDVPFADAPGWFLALLEKPAIAVDDGEKRGIDYSQVLKGVPEGERDDTLFRMASKLRGEDYPRAIAETLVLTAAANCSPPFPEKQALKCVASAYARYKPNAPAEPEIEPPATGFRRTDYGNAERFVAQHGQNARYCFASTSWYVWSGKRWTEDDSGAVVRMAKETVRSIYVEAAKAETAEERGKIADWAKKSEKGSAIAAMITLAQSEPGIPVTPADFDVDPWLFNCANGTLNLRSGKLESHRREDLITRLSRVSYDPGARNETWERFIATATAGDVELAGFLKRAAGLTASGDISDEVLFFLHGPQATGKSSFVEAIKSVLGDYAATADFETFVRRKDVGTPRHDIARLAGARLVASIEVDEGRELAEGLIKMMTGGDTITARHLYKSAFEFTPQFKLWLSANHAPKVRADDGGMWRRILRIPFEAVIPKGERDPKVKAELRDPKRGGPAILAWMVQGLLEWRRNGLGVPPIVEQATEEYRADMNPLKDFIADCCVEDPKVWAPAAALYAAYQAWVKEDRDRKPLTKTAFGIHLSGRGLTNDRQYVGSKRTRCWMGIAIAGEIEDDELDSDDSGTGGTGRTQVPETSQGLRLYESTLPEVASQPVPPVPDTDLPADRCPVCGRKLSAIDRVCLVCRAKAKRQGAA